MVMTDATTNLILKLSKFVAKRGADLDSRRELVAAIDDITGTPGMLDGIFVNTVDNYLIPDVAVIHLYYPEFTQAFLLNTEGSETCPFGYTIEIHERCFEKYTEEELAAVIIHDILQNVQSDTAKIRFLKAYTAVLSKYKADLILDLFESINLDEVGFMAFTSICLRPFRVPVEGFDYVATDDVLKAMGLADAYDSYLNKVLDMSNKTVEEVMETELRNDFRDVNTIIRACLDNDIRHYYTVVRDSAPLITLNNILGSRQGMASIGFVSRKKAFKRKHEPQHSDKIDSTLSESFNNPKSDLELRYQIDKIINNMRYMETESEREVILYKIKNLSLKIMKIEQKLGNKNDPNTEARRNTLKEYLAELESLRKKTVEMEIKVKRWSVYVKDTLPAGYDF